MEVCHHHKSEEDILTSASFSARQLEYDTLKSLQLKVIMSFLAGKDVLPSFIRGMERAFAMLFFRSVLIACIDCKEIAALLLKRNFHPDRACFLATGLPVKSGPSFLQSLDDLRCTLSSQCSEYPLE